MDNLRYAPLDRGSAGTRPRRTAALLRVACAVAITLVAGACGGGTDVPPVPTVARFSGDEQAGTVNTMLALPLSVRVTGTDGTPLQGVTVSWAVTAGGGTVSPTESVTNGEGVATTVWTLGPTTGEQIVTASVQGASTRFRAVATGLAECGAAVSLPVGGGCLASPTRAVNVDVSAGGSAAEFVAVVSYDASVARPSTSVNASATGTVAAGVVGPPLPSLSPPSFDVVGSSFALSQDLSFEGRLRRRERTELAPMLAAVAARRADALAGELGARTTATPGDLRRVVVDDVLTLNTNSQPGLANACSVAVNKQGIVRKVSPHAIIVEDTENATPGFTSAEYDQIVAAFESVIWPALTTTFGEPTDVDGNAKRVIIFYTVEVNKLTPPNSNAFVGGFFYSRDLFPRSTAGGLGGCPTSNVAEMFYMLAPDGSRLFSQKEEVLRTTPGTIAHEFQHLISASRRLYIIPGAPRPLEQVWLDEGISHIAEELAFYWASGMSPRSDLDSTAIRQSGVLAAVNTYQASNLGRFRRYLLTPHSNSPYGKTRNDDSLETRGAIWSFLRWAADHRGSGDGDTWSALVNSGAVGEANLRGVFGNSITSRVRDWNTANYTDNAVSTGNPAFTHPSWNYRSVIPLLDPPTTVRKYPLLTFVLTDAAPATFDLREGGAGYLRFGVAANATANVRITTSGGQLPSGASVWFLRTK